jgi:hypothetical protein
LILKLDIQGFTLSPLLLTTISGFAVLSPVIVSVYGNGKLLIEPSAKLQY